jgi:UDP-N-acetylmuramoyl-tripeptide--D-alanyl-D-alanine ligase
MLTMSLSQIANTCGADFALHGASARIAKGISTDSRTLQPEALFVALKGERFDGHDHVQAALRAGASAAVVGRRYAKEHSAMPMLGVDDSYEALQQIAGAWRKTLSLPVIAITGSNGKTSVKEMLRTILIVHCDGVESDVLATQGNLNNHIGVPLMLARLSAAHRYGVFEAGMNHFGEISLLTRLIAPNVAVINNAAPAHLEGVGSMDGVARAKAEIFEGLTPSGIAVINADDRYCDYWKSRIGQKRTVSFGMHIDATVRGVWKNSDIDDPMTVRIGNDAATFSLAVQGAHNRMNALAAAAAAHALDIPLATITHGLQQFRGIPGRQAVRVGLRGARVIDDTYNANPASMRAGIDALAALPGKRILVLGQMAELGAESESLHREVGEAAKASGIERVFATGERMKAAVETCGATAQWFATKSQLIDALCMELAPHVSVLVKGSRSSEMEDVVNAILDPQTQGTA